MKYRVILAVFAGFLLGTYAAGLGLSGWVALGAAILAGGGMLLPHARVAAIYAFAFFASSLLGLIYFHSYISVRIAQTQIPTGLSELSGLVQSADSRGANLQFVGFKLDAPAEGTAYFLTNYYPEYHAGDRIVITAGLRAERDNRGRLVFNFPSVQIQDPAEATLGSRILNVRLRATNIITHALPSREGALAVGLLFGDTSGFTPDFKNDMRQSGTTHLVALSGYNITVIVGALAGMARTLRLRNKLRFLVTVSGIILFLVMTSAAPSLVRAAAMGVLVLIATASGRASNFGYATALAGAGMALWDPTAPSADIGFQLSFLSLLGVSYIAPALRQLPFLRGEDGRLPWRAGLAATAGAQLMVLPILVQVFGGFSGIALISNLLILGLVPETMFLAAVLAALGAVLLILANSLALLVWLPATFMVQVITLSAKMGGHLLTLPLNSFWLTAAYYALIAALIARTVSPVSLRPLQSIQGRPESVEGRDTPTCPAVALAEEEAISLGAK